MGFPEGQAPSCPELGGEQPGNLSGNQESRKPVNSRTVIFDRIYRIGEREEGDRRQEAGDRGT